MKGWKISEAKARLSEVVSHSVEEPQVLYNRKKPVAALIDMEEYERFLEYKKSKKKKSIAEWLDELDEIKKQEPGDFELPSRTSRPIPYLDEWSDE
jgi:prevent-host-death family protein